MLRKIQHGWLMIKCINHVKWPKKYNRPLDIDDKWTTQKHRRIIV